MRELVYAQNEKELKKYNYATVKNKGKIIKNPTQKNLIVTNKRIINETISKTGVVRNEIPISSVDFIESDYSTQNRKLFSSIITIIIGIILTIVAAIEVEGLLPIGLIIAGLGIIFLIINILSGKTSVYLSFCGCKNRHNILSLGSSNMGIGRKLRSRTKIKVDREIANEMVEEIGAIILNVHEDNR